MSTSHVPNPLLRANPTGDLRLEEGDLVIALGTESQLMATVAMVK